MSLAPQAKYTENMKATSIGKGILQTALDVDFHRSLLDIETCETFTEMIHTNKSHPYVLGTRLKVVDGKISEIETLVTDKGDWLFNADNYLMYSQKEKWDAIPAAQRSDRQTLINAASAYFDVFSDKNAKVSLGNPLCPPRGRTLYHKGLQRSQGLVQHRHFRGREHEAHKPALCRRS
jgi:hypothetical protein